MNSSRFADFTSSFDANPRFYDRCIAVCSVLLMASLASAIFLKVNDQPRVELRGVGEVLSAPAATPELAATATAETKVS